MFYMFPEDIKIVAMLKPPPDFFVAKLRYP